MSDELPWKPCHEETDRHHDLGSADQAPEPPKEYVEATCLQRSPWPRHHKTKITDEGAGGTHKIASTTIGSGQ
ncbi:hypothetical protein MTO96_025960 [Rhipicephalus appendiculatus]